ncbi:protein GDAP2 homolog [Tubulanus polymorphus]|uniref:protein GDAP2 homolog n=1 Tax=Tubulanus polymorphus TaxID=672921 RepID=UPI003DA53025
MDPLNSGVVDVPPEPLGAPSEVIDINGLQTWAETEIPEYIHIPENRYWTQSPFTCDNQLNKTVCLWTGDQTRLNVIALVNPTNESLTDRNPISEKIFIKAGPELITEIKRDIRVCKTGEAKLTKGYNLISRYVIHTVGPRYNTKYCTAAESALFNCYRNVMQLVKEHEIRTIGISCIHSLRRNYPPQDGTHIALRTVRRFLERNRDIVEKVVFICTELEEADYRKLLPLYFPRNEREEQFAAAVLPKSIGNDIGEPVIPERQIRIADNPLISKNGDTRDSPKSELDEPQDEVAIHELLNMSVSVGEHSFAKMEGDHDSERRQRIHGKTTIEAEHIADVRRYGRLVRRARQEDLSEIVSLRCFYHSGVDKNGCPVIVFIAKHFPYNNVNLEKALLYLIHVMDQIVNERYVVVYAHSLTTKDNQPALGFLKEVYQIVDERYKRNLKAFYLLHCSVWSKVLTWFFTTFTAPNIKNKVHTVRGVEELYTKINPDQLDLPPFVMDHDFNINGTRYYMPTEADLHDDL